MPRISVPDDPTLLVPPVSAGLVQAVLDRAHREEVRAGRALLQTGSVSRGPLLARTLAHALTGHGRSKRQVASLRPTAPDTGGRSFHFNFHASGKGGHRKRSKPAADAHASAAGSDIQVAAVEPTATQAKAGKVTKGTPKSAKSPGVAHQEYIERFDAVAESVSEDVAGHARGRGDGATISAGVAAPSPQEPPMSVQAYMEDPAKVRDGTGASFGTIGSTVHERVAFWELLEQHTAEAAGRTQLRLVLELPHETTAVARQEIVRKFCERYEQLGVPYWACIHAPTGTNDARNYHAHIVHAVRPARKMADPVTGNDVWDFSITEAYRTKSRNTKIRHPHRQTQCSEFRDRSYPHTTRQRFAAVVNAVMERHECPVRYDPRSYEAMGVAVKPAVSKSRKAVGRSAKNPTASDAEWIRMLLEREAGAAAAREKKALHKAQAERERLLAACADVGKMARANRWLPLDMRVSPSSRLTPVLAKAIAGELHDALHMECTGAFADDATSRVLQHLLDATAPNSNPAGEADCEARALLHLAAQDELSHHQQQAHERARRSRASVRAARRIWGQEAMGLPMPPGYVPRMNGRPIVSENAILTSVASTVSGLTVGRTPHEVGMAVRALLDGAGLTSHAMRPQGIPEATKPPTEKTRSVTSGPKLSSSVVIGEAEEVTPSLSMGATRLRADDDLPARPTEMATMIGRVPAELDPMGHAKPTGDVPTERRTPVGTVPDDVHVLAGRVNHNNVAVRKSQAIAEGKAWAASWVGRAPVCAADPTRVAWIVSRVVTAGTALADVVNFLSAKRLDPLAIVNRTLGAGYQEVSVSSSDLLRILAGTKPTGRGKLDQLGIDARRESQANVRQQQLDLEADAWAEALIARAPRSIMSLDHLTWTFPTEDRQREALEDVVALVGTQSGIKTEQSSGSVLYELAVPISLFKGALASIGPELRETWDQLGATWASISSATLHRADRILVGELTRPGVGRTSHSTDFVQDISDPSRVVRGVIGPVTVSKILAEHRMTQPATSAGAPQKPVHLGQTPEASRPDAMVQITPNNTPVAETSARLMATLKIHSGSEAWAAQYCQFHFERDYARRDALLRCWAKYEGEQVAEKVRRCLRDWVNSKNDRAGLIKWMASAPSLTQITIRKIDAEARSVTGGSSSHRSLGSRQSRAGNNQKGKSIAD